MAVATRRSRRRGCPSSGLGRQSAASSAAHRPTDDGIGRHGPQDRAHRVYRASRDAVRDVGLDPSADLLALDRSIAVGHTRFEPEPPTGNLAIPTPSGPRAPGPGRHGAAGAATQLVRRPRRRPATRCPSCSPFTAVVSIVGPGGVGGDKAGSPRHRTLSVTGTRTASIWVELQLAGRCRRRPGRDRQRSAVVRSTTSWHPARRCSNRSPVRSPDNGCWSCSTTASTSPTTLPRSSPTRIAGAGTVDVLLTGRVPLRVDDEHVVVLAPLAENDEARLFLDRPRGRRCAGRRLAPAGADVVAEIVGGCSRVCRWCSSSPRHACPDSDCVA